MHKEAPNSATEGQGARTGNRFDRLGWLRLWRPRNTAAFAVVYVRDWRRRFAGQLRAQGVAANARKGQFGVRRERLSGMESFTPSNGVPRRTCESARSERRNDLTLNPQSATQERRCVSLLTDGHGRAEHVWKLIGGMTPPQTEQQSCENKLATSVDKQRQLERGARGRLRRRNATGCDGLEQRNCGRAFTCAEEFPRCVGCRAVRDSSAHRRPSS